MRRLPPDPTSMDAILTAILDDDRSRVEKLLKADPRLATRLIDAARLYESKIVHWIYVGDTALHLAAAGYRVEIVRLLLAVGADPNAAQNRRRSSPLHYAADGFITGPAWDVSTCRLAPRRFIWPCKIPGEVERGAPAAVNAQREIIQAFL